MILIKNGRMIDPSQNKDEISDILIDNGRITDIQKDIKNVPDGCEVIDATGCIVAPGFMDGHVHFRDPGFTHKEDIETGAAAAKKRRIHNSCMYGKHKACDRQHRHP